MQALLTNPAFQAAVAPFIVAMALALLLRRFSPGAMGIAIVAGFFVAVFLITGLTLLPLQSKSKIIMCSFSLPFIALVLEVVATRLRSVQLKYVVQALPALVVSAAVLWITWTVVKRQDGMAAWSMAVPIMGYAAVIMLGMGALGRLRNDVPRVFNMQVASLLVLAMGTGAVTMIVASALYSQLAFAVLAATGAVVVVRMLRASDSTMPLSALEVYAAAVPVTLLGSVAVVYAKLPVLVLLSLAFVPLVAWMPLITPQQRWLKLIVTCLWTSIPVIPAVWLAWRSAGPVSF